MKNTLSVKTMFTLCNWLRDNAAAVAGQQYKTVAEKAAAALECPITVSNIKAASEATGVQVGKVPAVHVDPHIRVIAHELAHFMAVHGYEVSDRLAELGNYDNSQFKLPGIGNGHGQP